MSKDINILLLGQVGVGKTTFINAFANYLTHHTLDDAIKGDFKVVIPATFSYMDRETFDEIEITIGTPDESEQTRTIGESCTRECRSFVFRINNKNLRFIDTPGIGDTQGVLEDEKNFADILACISQYEHLDGICILLKPNEDRLTILFRYCLKELLRHLHIDAKENIMFVFTNARSTNYRADGAARVLQKLLDSLKIDIDTTIPFTKENTFFLDNESFRFLAVCKNRNEVSPEDKNGYSGSWSHTIKEFQRLVSRIVICEKHATRDTISLNETQQLIRKLSRPIGEITTLIEQNINLVQTYKKNASSNNTSKQEILEQLDMEIIELQYPRTVCTNDKYINSTVVDERLKILKSEKDAILGVCSKLAYFIRTNSINPVNDDIVEYIQHFIREEKQKRNAGTKNDDNIIALEKLEEGYRKEIDSIKQLMNISQNNSSNSNSVITPGKISDLVHDLYHLPLYGKKLRAQVEQIKLMQQNARRDREHIVNLSTTAESSPIMTELRKVIV